jgi:SOS response regulatory protein OraA/RecX
LAFRRHRAGDKIKPASAGEGHLARSRSRAVERKPVEGEPVEEARQDKARTSNVDKTRQRIMVRAINILAARPRSEAQLRERLLEKPWAEPALVDECLARLKELGYVNDGLFAHNYASYRVSAKPVGRSRLARELAGKKVARQTINEALDEVFEEVGEESLIDRAIEKRIRIHGRPSGRNDAKRMFDYLARLGFNYDLIIRKLQALRAEIEEND